MSLPAGEYESQWKPLHQKTVDLSRTRNVLAHHPTHGLGTARDGNQKMDSPDSQSI